MVSEELSERTMAKLTEVHLARLSGLAREDHEKFFLKQPAFRDRCLAIVLAQGGAQHYVDGKSGVKDLDVWTFFALPPGVHTFPAPIRSMHVDFGPSELGREPYDLSKAKNDTERAKFRKWSTFSGRRVDLLMRGLRVDLDADPADAIRNWLRPGATAPKNSPEFLAKKAIVVIDPEPRRGEILWSLDTLPNDA